MPGYKCRCEGSGFYGNRCQVRCPAPHERVESYPVECIIIWAGFVRFFYVRISPESILLRGGSQRLMRNLIYNKHNPSTNQRVDKKRVLLRFLFGFQGFNCIQLLVSYSPTLSLFFLLTAFSILFHIISSSSSPVHPSHINLCRTLSFN